MKLIDVKGKSVFLSGPMTGIEHFNVEAFAKAHAQLKELEAKDVYNPGISYLYAEEHDHKYWMRRCVDELVQGRRYGAPYDLVVQLKGWSKSEGCRTEAQVASACGIPCVTMKRVLKDAEAIRQHRAAVAEDHVKYVCVSERGGSLTVDGPRITLTSSYPYDNVTEA